MFAAMVVAAVATLVHWLEHILLRLTAQFANVGARGRKGKTAGSTGKLLNISKKWLPKFSMQRILPSGMI